MWLLNYETTAVFLICSSLGYIIYKMKRKYEYWKDRGVPQIGVASEWVANFWKHKVFVYQEIYDKFADLPYAGFYSVASPFLMVMDPELIRNVCIKNFSHFTDRGIIDVDIDPLQRDNIFNMKGDRWRHVRAKLTPIFSSGKLRRMNILMQALGDIEGILIQYCFAGWEDSAFRRMLRQMLSPKVALRVPLLLAVNAVCPRILEYFKISLIHPEIESFFRSLVAEAVKDRQNAKVKREDFMQRMIDVRADEERAILEKNDGSVPLFDEDVCMANAFIFFGAGFEPIATSLSHCLYDLALNPDVMQKLYHEIEEVKAAHGDTIDYDVLKKMEYLDCVVSETLRLHPPAGWLQRVCNLPFQLPDSSVTISKGINLLIPIRSIQIDSRYWSDPLKYDPERFNSENIGSIVPGTYLPFGDGPRICIAQRFALLEMKMALVSIVGKYTVQPSPKTQIPLKLSPLQFNNTPDQIYLKICRRGQK